MEIIIILLAFYKEKNVLKKAKILSYGVNKMGDINGLNPGIHAEHDAIKRLLPLNRTKRMVNINLLVIRVSGKNKLQSSKPCETCINTMRTLPEKLGYKIKHIYYSNNTGDIIKTNLQKLEIEDKHYSKYYRKTNKFSLNK